MPFKLIEALVIDYLHRNGGQGEKQAVVEYMEEVAGYSAEHARRALEDLANAGALESQRGGGGRSSLYSIDYDSDMYNGDDGL